jgi:hypothetical protein
MSNNFLDKDGNVIAFDFNTTLGRKGAALSRSFALSTEDNAALTAIGAQLPATLGTKTAANSLAVTLASDGPFVTSIGAPSDAAWTTGNGTQIALLKAIAGAAVDTTTASPVKIDQTTDGTTNKVNITASLRASGTATKANVASSTTSGTILASNANRKGATIWNDSTAVLYLDLTGGTASATSCSKKLAADEYYEVPFGLSGAITGVWATANGSARVTEIV